MGTKTRGLIDAAKVDDLASIERLLWGGVNINAKDKGGSTALIWAAWEGRLDAVRYLVEHGADIEAKNNADNTALIWAAWNGHIGVVRYLVEQGADKEAKNKDGTTALLASALHGHQDAMQYLVEQGVDIEAKNIYNVTALLGAAMFGHMEVVRYLVEQGANIDVKEENGRTARMWADQNGHQDVVQYLVQHGANKETKNNTGITSLIEASRHGRLDAVRHLVQQGANVNEKNNDGCTALSLAADQNFLDVARYLIEQDADKEVKNKNGWTALTCAAYKGHLDMVRFLVEQGADVNAKGDNANTAMIRAAWEGHLDVVRCLVEQGADKEAEGYIGNTALICSAERGHLGVVRYLVEQGVNLNYKRNDGSTALMKATSYGHLNVVGYLRYFVDQGPDKNAEDKDDQSALIWAARCGQVDVVRKLVEKGVDSSRLDNQGNSALTHLLLSEYSIEEDNILPTVKLLLEHGSPPLQSNNQGKSAKSIARKKGYHGVLDLIKEYASKPRAPARFASEPVLNATEWFISPEKVRYAEKPFANGGFGKVYRAKWEHRDVILKEITINSVVDKEAFLREVKNWYKARHPNIVPFYGANHLETPCFMISQFATKGTLKDYLHTEKKLNQSIVWRKLLDVAHGLSFLHGLNIVHGDLKGDNIVIGEDGTAMLTDFGLSFTEFGSCFLKTLKDTLGAMQWRAPELAMMTKMTPTRKSDVYSLGMCIIEAVIGTTPWGVGFHANEIRGFLRRNEVKLEKPKEMTDAQWGLVSRMIAYEPENRPGMEGVLSELERFAETEKKNEEARQVVSKVQDAHDTDVHDVIGVGAVNVQSGGTHRTPAQTSAASANWSNRKSASTSF